MFTILLFVLFAFAILLGAMWLLPSFKNKVATKWGAFGAALIGALAWLTAWFAGAPPTLP